MSGFELTFTNNLEPVSPKEALEQTALGFSFQGELSLDTYARLMEWAVPPRAEIVGGPFDGAEVEYGG